MRIAFCGKGGSGKTSIASLFIRYLADKGEDVLAIDGDINQHLATALGLDPQKTNALPRLGQQMKTLKNYVAGQNKRINLCMSHDMLRYNKTYPEILPQSGDLVAFPNTAAYMMDFMESETLMQPVAQKIALTENNGSWQWAKDRNYRRVA